MKMDKSNILKDSFNFNVFKFESILALCNRNKSKNKQMEPNQIYKLLYSKANKRGGHRESTLKNNSEL